MLSSFNANSIGTTGPGFGLEAAALTGVRAVRAYFTGHNLVLAVIAVPLLTAVSLGLAAFAGHPADGLWAVAIDFAGVGAGLALSSIYTATLAYPAEKRVGSPVPGAADGYGGQALAGALGSIFGVAAATVPVILAAELIHLGPAAVRLPVLMLCAASYGIALAWAGGLRAARAASQRLPELCQIAIRSNL